MSETTKSWLPKDLRGLDYETVGYYTPSYANWSYQVVAAKVQDELKLARKKATGWKGLRVYKIVKSNNRSSRYELVHDEETA